MKQLKEIQDWFDQIDAGLEYRRIFAREDSWRKCEANYLNEPSGHTAIGPNLVFEMGDALTSILTVPDPEFVITPTRSRSVPMAPIVEAVDNTFIEELRLKRYIEVAILRGFVYGNIILKIGYDSEFGWSPYYDIGGEQLLGMTFTQFDKRGRRIETPDTKPGWPWVRPVLPHDFVVPWGTMFLEDAPWAAHRIVRHVNYFKRDPKYKNTTNLTPQINMKDFMESYLSTGMQKQQSRKHRKANVSAVQDPEYVVAWEIVDRMKGERLVISRDHPSFLRKAPDAIQMACGMPFIDGSLNIPLRSFWCVAPAYYLGQHQKEQFDISLQATKERRINILRFLYRKNAIDQKEFNRLMSADVGAAAPVETTFPLKEVIAPVNQYTNYDYVHQSESNRRNARSVAGMSRNQMGEFDQSTRRTASEAKIVQAGSGRRTSKRGQVVQSLYTGTIKKCNGLIFDFWTVPREVMHKDGFEMVTGEMLKGNYLYDVSLNTKRAISRAERKVEALMLMGQIMAMLGPGLNPQALYQYLIDASGDPSFESILAPGAGRLGGQGGGAKGQLPAGPMTGA